MMGLEQLSALVIATLVLVAMPGPSVAVIVARTLSHGRVSGLATVAGTTLGVAAQLVFLVAGLLVLAEQIASILFWVKWLGVLYLLYIGLTTFFAPAEELMMKAPDKTALFRTAAEGFAVAIINPKTLLFNAAFLMQFVDPASAAGSQLTIVSLVFLATLGIGDCGWVLLADKAGSYLQSTGRVRNRIVGSFLAVTAVVLAVARRA